MIDVVHQTAIAATISGSCRKLRGAVSLTSTKIGTIGTVEFGTFAPRSLVKWLSAEIGGVSDQNLDSVRVRIGTDDRLYYIDEADSLRIKPVTNESSWDSECSSPLSLASLDLWTDQTVRVVVCLRSTTNDRTPSITGLVVAMDLPLWEGVAAQAARKITELAAGMRPVLLHNETLAEAKSEYKLGEPHTEFGHQLTELVMASVDGVERSATLSNGIVRLMGNTPTAGQRVSIAVRYKPQTTVRRLSGVRIANQLPCFIIGDLVRGGGMNGTLPTIHVNGIEIRRRMLGLRIQVQGMAYRQADAYAMRDSIQETFGGTAVIVLDSGRTIGAAVIDLVEVSASGQDSSTAIGTINCPTTEYTGYTRVGAARRGEPGSFTLPTNVISITNADGTVQTYDETS